MIGNDDKVAKRLVSEIQGHHSLVTPIDWKLGLGGEEGLDLAGSPLVGDTY